MLATTNRETCILTETKKPKIHITYAVASSWNRPKGCKIKIMKDNHGFEKNKN